MTGRLRLAGLGLAIVVLGCGRVGYLPLGVDADSPDSSAPPDTSLADGGSDAPRPIDAGNGGDAGGAGDVGRDTAMATDAAADGAPDTGPPPARSCLELLQSGAAADGVYTIDVDGPAGPVTPAAVYCDMTFAGGGWTLIESYDGTNVPRNLAPDNGNTPFLTAAPRPLTFGALGSLLLDPLAAKATQVHIRNSFTASAANADPTSGWFATSRAPAANEVTVPVANLRNHHLLNDGTNGSAADWTGPRVANLTWTTSFSCNISSPKYPDLYWACNNATGLHIINDAARWDYSAVPQQPMEAYVR